MNSLYQIDDSEYMVLTEQLGGGGDVKNILSFEFADGRHMLRYLGDFEFSDIYMRLIREQQGVLEQLCYFDYDTRYYVITVPQFRSMDFKSLLLTENIPLWEPYPHTASVPQSQDAASSDDLEIVDISDSTHSSKVGNKMQAKPVPQSQQSADNNVPRPASPISFSTTSSVYSTPVGVAHRSQSYYRRSQEVSDRPEPYKTFYEYYKANFQIYVQKQYGDRDIVWLDFINYQQTVSSFMSVQGTKAHSQGVRKNMSYIEFYRIKYNVNLSPTTPIAYCKQGMCTGLAHAEDFAAHMQQMGQVNADQYIYIPLQLLHKFKTNPPEAHSLKWLQLGLQAIFTAQRLRPLVSSSAVSLYKFWHNLDQIYAQSLQACMKQHRQLPFFQYPAENQSSGTAHKSIFFSAYSATTPDQAIAKLLDCNEFKAAQMHVNVPHDQFFTHAFNIAHRPSTRRQRVEFLGDSALGYLITEKVSALGHEYMPMKARFVSNGYFCQVYQANFGALSQILKPQELSSVKSTADALESIFGFLYLTYGIEYCDLVLSRLFIITDELRTVLQRRLFYMPAGSRACMIDSYAQSVQTMAATVFDIQTGDDQLRARWFWADSVDGVSNMRFATIIQRAASQQQSQTPNGQSQQHVASQEAVGDSAARQPEMQQKQPKPGTESQQSEKSGYMKQRKNAQQNSATSAAPAQQTPAVSSTLTYQVRRALQLEHYLHGGLGSELEVALGRILNGGTEAAEMLGDAFLKLSLTVQLYFVLPEANEGVLTLTRQVLENNVFLARTLYEKIPFAAVNLVQLKGIRRDSKHFGDLFESMIAAILLSAGYHAAGSAIKRLIHINADILDSQFAMLSYLLAMHNGISISVRSYRAKAAVYFDDTPVVEGSCIGPGAFRALCYFCAQEEPKKALIAWLES